MNNKYWLYLESFVHLALKNNNALLYNPYSGTILEYDEKSPGILSLLRRIQAPRNLGVISLRERDLKNPEVSRFLKDIRQYFMGDILDSGFSSGKPVQMMTFPKVQAGIEYLKKEENQSVGEALKKYLTQVSIYLTEKCEHSCSVCPLASHQFFTCYSGKRNRELDIEALGRFFDELEGLPALHINITGGNPFLYSRWDELLKQLDILQGRQSLNVHYLNLLSGESILKKLDIDKTDIKLHISFPVDGIELEKSLDMLRSTNSNHSLQYIVEGLDHLENVEAILKRFPTENVEILPYYNGDNLNFFKEYLYISRDRISEAKPSLKEIYANSFVNSHYFGQLILLADGTIRSRMKGRILGKIEYDSIYDILKKEIEKPNNWRKIRKNIVPCKTCEFEALCPPISNYNYAIGKYNLCNIL